MKETYPRCALSKAATQDWAKDGTDEPRQTDQSDKFTPLLKSENIGHQYVSHGQKPTAADALDGAAKNENGHMVSDTTNDSTDGEEDQGYQDHRLATEGIRKRREDRLDSGRAQDEGSASPESFGAAGIEFGRNGLIR